MVSFGPAKENNSGSLFDLIEIGTELVGHQNCIFPYPNKSPKTHLKDHLLMIFKAVLMMFLQPMISTAVAYHTKERFDDYNKLHSHCS